MNKALALIITLLLLNSCVSLTVYRPASTTTSYISAAHAVEEANINCLSGLDPSLLSLPNLPNIPNNKLHDRDYVEVALVDSINDHRQKLKRLYDHLSQCH